MRPDTEELYDRYLDACLTGDVEDPDTFCGRFPDISPRLRNRLAALHLLMSEQQAAESSTPRLEAEDGLPFERLGEFRLIRSLDKGGMGMVYLAEQESLGRPVALKVVRPELQDSPTATERFRREALVIARLQHPNIVRVFAMGEDQGVRFIAMELAAGRTLDELLADKTPPASRVVRWVMRLARALDYAHKEGVIHRDVKPSNVRITPDDRPLLLDFGVARDTRWKGKTLTQAFTGSPLYAAPEQLRGEPIDGRADVYALGVTLYQCLTGRVPFEGEGMEQVFAQALTQDPVPPRKLRPSLSRDLEVITLKALAKDPARRYASAADLADDLEALLEFRPISARAPGPWDRFAKWCRRRPGPAAALVTIVLGLVVAAGWGAWKERSDAREALVAAQQRLDEYRNGRDEIGGIEARLTKLQDEMHARYMTREEERLLEEQESVIARSRRAREETFHEVLELLRRAESHDPDATRAVRAALYFEKWRDARAADDQVQASLYHGLVLKHDDEERFTRELKGGGELRVISTPTGADIYLFKFVEQASVVAGGDHRLVPVPVGGETPVPPGTWALRVVRAVPGVGRSDVILAIAGHPIRDSVLALEGKGGVEIGDRLLSVDDRPMRDLWDVETLESPKRYRFARAGEVADVTGVRFGTPAELAERGGVEATVFSLGETRTEVLPEGLRVRTTATPIFLTPACHVGRAPLHIHVDAVDHMLVARLDGFVDARYVGPRHESFARSVGLVLQRAAEIPAGFVRLPLPREVWMMEREVTAGEYLEFLGHPAVRARVTETSLWPRAPDELLWKRDPRGRFALPDDWTPDMPALGVSWHDAVAYAKWKTESEGGGYEFALPTYDEWVHALGETDREYVFGDRFRPKWVKSNYARTEPSIEPVMRFPIDESPYGIYDLCGSAMEWLDDWYFEAAGARRLGGGSWAHAKRDLFKHWGNAGNPDTASGTYGFRLVMRKK